MPSGGGPCRDGRLFSAWLAVVLVPGVALAGMPTPVFTEWATMRFSTISFFLFVLLISALVVKVLWNALAKDFSKLPRLGYFRALALVVLWGFLFLFVLTMIAGARELMTPEAWQLQGVTYKIVGQNKDKGEDNAGAREASPASLDVRRQSLERWKLRWTLFSLVGVVFLFVAGIAVTGLAHQVGWLMASDEPWITSSGLTASYRAVSTNNLKQIGLGFPTAETNRQLPTGRYV